MYVHKVGQSGIRCIPWAKFFKETIEVNQHGKLYHSLHTCDPVTSASIIVQLTLSKMIEVFKMKIGIVYLGACGKLSMLNSIKCHLIGFISEGRFTLYTLHFA